MCAASEHADPLGCDDALAPRCALRHAALLYDSPDAFLAVAVPFVRDGLAAGERTLAVIGSAHAAALTDALGDDAARADVRTAEQQLTDNPWRTLAAFRRWLEEHASGGRRARIVGEPFAVPRGPAATREWTRCEALVNDAFAAIPATVLCPYDVRRLDDATLAHARCTHPAIVDADGRCQASDEHLDARALSAELDADPLPPVPPAAAAQPIAAPTSLSALRAFVGERAAAAGLAGERAADVTFAAHELTVNAREHGGGAGTLRTWTAGGAFVCEVADDGAGMRDPLAGTSEPLPLQPDGRGLWLARQLCDVVQVRSGTGGTVVRLQMALA